MAKDTKEAASAVSANPAFVEFPRDEWGFTSELRKAGLRAASAVRGNGEKQKLFLDTIRVLAQHSLARLDADAAELKKLGEEIAARDASTFHRVNSRSVVPAAPVAAPEATAE